MTMPAAIKSPVSVPVPKLERLSTAPRPAVAGLSLSFFTDPAEIADQWLAFETSAHATLFQSYKWVSAWCRKAARAYGEHPLIVAGYDSTEQLALIWPMAIVQRSGLCMLTWLGQGITNYNFGLYRRDIIDRLGPAEICEILAQIERHRPDIDAIRFLKQPFEWDGVKNPLAQLYYCTAASRSYARNLSLDFESLYASTFSAKTRSQHRRKERKLAAIGDVKIAIAETVSERIEVLETFLSQKAVRLHNQDRSNVFEDSRAQIFYRELARDTREGAPFEYTSVIVGDTVAATFHGTRFQDKFYFLNTSMDLGELKQWSPGFILLREAIAQQCRQGTAIFDFGPGENKYKAAWDVYEVPLFETHFSLSLQGLAATLLSQAKAHSKLAIKQRSFLRKTARSIRGLKRALQRSTVFSLNSS